MLTLRNISGIFFAGSGSNCSTLDRDLRGHHMPATGEGWFNFARWLRSSN
jgi:hypothetical protein